MQDEHQTYRLPGRRKLYNYDTWGYYTLTSPALRLAEIVCNANVLLGIGRTRESICSTAALCTKHLSVVRSFGSLDNIIQAVNTPFVQTTMEV